MEVIKAQEEAALSDDINRMQEIEEALRGAAEWRDMARQAIKNHEATTQSGSGDKRSMNVMQRTFRPMVSEMLSSRRGS